MGILSFLRPDKVTMVEANDFYGKYKFGPLEPTFGVTVGNAMRRVLLSSLEGFGMWAVLVVGVVLVPHGSFRGLHDGADRGQGAGLPLRR